MRNRIAGLILGALAPGLSGAVAEDIRFEPNRGQAPAAARFVGHAGGYRVLLESSAAIFDFGGSRASIRLAGAKPQSVEGEDPTPAIRNYFQGDASGRWLHGIPTFRSVRYSSALPGVDLVYYGNPGLEFDLALSPGADPAAIEFRYEGFRTIEIEANGDLRLATMHGVMRQHLPEVTQQGHRVRARYVRRGARAIGLELDAYDKTRPLLIDPRISYATYLGGNGAEIANAVAADADGNYYVAVQTDSPNYPKLPAGQALAGGVDIVVSKFSAANALVYSTVIGGNAQDTPLAAVVDSDGSLYLSFLTTSTNFPKPGGAGVGSGANGTGVLKLNSTGSLVAAAFLFSTSSTNAFGITLDSSRNVWITGGTSGFTGQAGAIQANVAGSGDVFVARFNNALTQLTYFTYLGSSADEFGLRIAVDPAGMVFVSGNGGSAAFPTGPSKAFPGAGSFVVKLDPVNNRILFATYVSAGAGGSLLLDGADVWVCATSNGLAFTPTSDAVQPAYGGGNFDMLLARLNASDGQIRYATYFGGLGNDFANGIAQDVYGNLIVYGNTTSTNMRVTPDAIRKTAVGDSAAFIVVVDPAGALVYSSYLGGTGFNIGISVAVDRLGNPIVVGATTATDFPTTSGALQPQYGGGQQEAYVARIELVAPTDPYLSRVAIQNAASFLGGPIAPGEIITIYPVNVGPLALVPAALTPDRHIATLIGGTRVLFDDIPAPLVYTVSGQISLVVPYEVQGKPVTRIVVEYNGVKSRSMVVPVTSAAPGVFTAGSGTGPAVVVNQDGSFNAPGQPADRGTIVVFFATGEGQTIPAGVDGRLNEFTRLEDFPRPVLPVKVTIGGQDAEVIFSAGAPSFLAGLMQFNVRVPLSAQTGAAVPLLVTIGGVASASNVTLAVR